MPSLRDNMARKVSVCLAYINGPVDGFSIDTRNSVDAGSTGLFDEDVPGACELRFGAFAVGTGTADEIGGNEFICTGDGPRLNDSAINPIIPPKTKIPEIIQGIGDERDNDPSSLRKIGAGDRPDGRDAFTDVRDGTKLVGAAPITTR